MFDPHAAAYAMAPVAPFISPRFDPQGPIGRRIAAYRHVVIAAWYELALAAAVEDERTDELLATLVGGPVWDEPFAQ